MNVFVIPSWYPTNSNPITGIFFKEQASAMAATINDINIGISTWGQNDERLLLWAGKPFSSALKLTNKPGPLQTKLDNNIVEYMTPAYTWSSKLLDGNLDKIIDANRSNFEQFSSEYSKPEIIHAHVGFPAGFIARQLSKIYKVPYIITEHMSPFPHQQFLSKAGALDERMKMAYHDASFNLCVSQSLRRKMTSFGIKKTCVVPNLVDEDFFVPSDQSTSTEAFTFFALGRMVPQKGIDSLLVAFSHINKKARLRIGGDGEHIEKYKMLASRLGIAHRVNWLGLLGKSAILTEFQNCDAFVLPSRHESMGVVFAEAMACGKPVIATICGGPEEFIDDSCGYLVEIDKEDQLNDAMNSMIDNHHNFDGKKIREHFKSKFSKAVVCEMIHEKYLTAINSYDKQ